MGRNKFLVSLLAVILGIITGALVMLLTGYDPIKAYEGLLRGAGFIIQVPSNATLGDILFNKRFGDTLLNTTTLILTGLSIAFAFKTGLINIGVPGQMLMGGFFGVFIGAKLSLPFYIHGPLAVTAAVLGGAL